MGFEFALASRPAGRYSSPMIAVAYQGVPGAYSELAAREYFRGPVRGVPQTDFESVFRAVRTGRAAYGIVPIENALTGNIAGNIELVAQHKLWICGETKLRVSHSLIAHRGITLKQIKRIFSHPQALGQCQAFLKRQHGVEAVAYFDTAGSVKHIAESGQRDTAAIAGRHCAAQYGLKVLKAAIEDNPRNFTRFVVLSRRATPPKKGKSHKTSIVFDLRSRPGALHLALGIFARLEIQLFRIESRPIPGRPWQYLFYLDFEGEVGAPKSHSAIAELRRMALQVRVLGSYPIG